MPKFLTGNYDLPDKGNEEPQSEEHAKSLTELFEEQALAKLGGSMCFVKTGKTFVWVGDDAEQSS